MSGEVHDAIVVGSGATGGWAAKALTESGLRVLVLEAGTDGDGEGTDAARPAPRGLHMRERQKVQSQCYACSPGKNHLFVDDIDNPYSTPAGKPFLWIRGRQVGGRSLTWAGHSYRMSDLDFKAATHDGFGEDWPITHADLAGYYDQVERFMGVSGSREAIPNLPDGSFCEPSAMTTGERRFKQAVERRWSNRRVISGRSAARRTTGALGRPDESTSYISSNESSLRAARATGRLTLRSGAVASQVLVDQGSGRASGIAYVDRITRQTHAARGRVLVLCASTIESTRLLLNSATSRHPHGLANSSGLLGCYLMDHLQLTVAGRATSIMDASPHQAEVSMSGMYVPQFRNVGERDAPFLRGYGVQGGVGRMSPAQLRMVLGSDADENQSAFWMSSFGEMLPRRENRVFVEPARLDAWGIPTVRIECAHSPNERDMAQDSLNTMKEMAREAGFEVTVESPGLGAPGSCVHEVGTARMGASPETSVLNRFNQSWDVPNLYVTDGASFVSQGPQNPTLTMMALTARACDHIMAGFKYGYL
jgi:choline dehydrogenase-like flavoprotein